MKRLLSALLCAILFFGLSSCGKDSGGSGIDDAYLEGLEQGEENIFLSLFNASSPQKILSYADVWETENFSLSFTDYMAPSTVSYGPSEIHTLKCELTLKDFTIDEAIEEEAIYLGIYSRTWNGKWSEVASNYEYYFMFIDNLTDSLGSHTGIATFGLYDNPRYVVTIIVIDGILYHASYHINEQ